MRNKFVLSLNELFARLRDTGRLGRCDEERLRKLVNSLNHSIQTRDTKGTLVAVNRIAQIISSIW